jgi:hypothetical protein
LTNHFAQAIAAPALKVSTRADATLADVNVSERVGTANGSGSRYTCRLSNPLETLFAVAMDFFEYLPDYEVLICRLREYAISLTGCSRTSNAGTREELASNI